jgi:hypothetical protein
VRSPLLVAAVPVPQDPAPPAPVFVARDPILPPPEQHARAEPKPRYKTTHVLKTTQPCADSCPFVCCRNGGFADALTATWRQQLRDADANGIASRRAYLGSLIRRETHSGKTRASSSRARVCRVLEARALGAARSQAQ